MIVLIRTSQAYISLISEVLTLDEVSTNFTISKLPTRAFIVSKVLERIALLRRKISRANWQREIHKYVDGEM